MKHDLKLQMHECIELSCVQVFHVLETNHKINSGELGYYALQGIYNHIAISQNNEYTTFQITWFRSWKIKKNIFKCSEIWV